MPRNYLQHGSRHRPQGTDPIPGVGTAYCTLFWSGTHSVAGSGGTWSTTWQEFDTTDGDIFGTNSSNAVPPTNTQFDTGLICMGQGVYFATGFARWELGAYSRASFINVPRGEVMTSGGGVPYKQIEALTTDSFGALTPGLANYSWQMMAVVDGDFGVFDLNHENYDGAAKNVLNVAMSVIYWACPVDLQNVYGP